MPLCTTFTRLRVFISNGSHFIFRARLRSQVQTLLPLRSLVLLSLIRTIYSLLQGVFTQRHFYIVSVTANQNCLTRNIADQWMISLTLVYRSRTSWFSKQTGVLPPENCISCLHRSPFKRSHPHSVQKLLARLYGRLSMSSRVGKHPDSPLCHQFRLNQQLWIWLLKRSNPNI